MHTGAWMQDAFGIVIFVVMVVGGVIAVLTLVTRESAYKQIGKGGLNDGTDRAPTEPMSGAGFEAVRDDEVRQMLEARNVRRTRQGKPALDVEDELARLTAARPAADPALEGEVRSLVQARNRRRVKQGKAPLDVEEEVRRQLAELA